MAQSDGTPTALITDLDNTLWDWFAAWYESFSAMLSRLTELSGIPQAVLETEIRRVHRERGTAEYSNLLDEIPMLNADGKKPSILYDDALHRQNSARISATKLYPTVLSTLKTLKNEGILIVAYTDSLAYWTEWRIKHTGLDGIIDILYSSPDHDLPNGLTVQDLRTRPEAEYGLRQTDHHHLPRGASKPNVKILRFILEDCGRAPAESVYVGDNLMKDIAMAQAAGVKDVHAAYGLAQDKPGYELLRRVSHWSAAEIEQEKLLATNGEVVPSIILRDYFGEILPLFGLEDPRDAT
jgi:FMN phosphatase YigB (HAD superfamily)